jgi:nitrite reductase/ring-hydroxylating ferredoxin subunit
MLDPINLEPQHLCDSSALEECGDAVTFEVLDQGQSAPAFAVRYDNVVVAYLNRCAHIPAEMDWTPGKFWDQDKRFIICAVHGALYDPPNGECVSGPCPGAKLIPIEVTEQAGVVHWHPTERLQPLF